MIRKLIVEACNKNSALPWKISFKATLQLVDQFNPRLESVSNKKRIVLYNQMLDDDKIFVQQLGKTIAALRKEEDLTQTQLADCFDITIDELLGIQQQAAKKGPTPKLQRQIEQIGQLPKAKQKFVMDMLDTVIQQKG